jgi:glycosyltransferase involved in cell wall biosynthesis
MIVGISMVRNEEDLVEITLRHHLGQGVERLIVADNGSTDGTARVLARMARSDRRISWTKAGTGFNQSDIVTALARSAAKDGATWILPFDADEFWYAPGGLATALYHSSADAISVGIVNFIQRRGQVKLEPRAVLSALHRSDVTFGDYRRARLGVEAGQFSYVEAPYQRKYISRAVSGMTIGPGNHIVRGVGPKRSRSRRFACFHLPLRAKDVFVEKARQSRRLEEAGLPFWHGWQSHRFAEALREGRVDEEWAANSQVDGHLDAARGRVKLTYDPRLRDVLRTCVE